MGLVLLGVVLVYTAWCHLPDLDHSYLPGWDEAVHAAVSGNLAKHPGTPTLFDQPFVHFNQFDWQANHIWLHMPPVPFWQAALSVSLGGRTFFALRLPSLLLFLLTLAMIYYIGLRLYSEAAGLIATVLMAASPFAWMQIQGYHFGDMTDISLAFWITACVVCLERTISVGKLRWALLGGTFQGLALLTKSALALAPLGACLAIWLLPKCKFRLDRQIGWLVTVSYIGLALVLALAWRFYTAANWPTEFAHEQSALWAHVTTSYEGHGRPWDALFNSLIAYLFSPALVVMILAGAAAVFLIALRRRSSLVGLHVLWLLGTWLPLLVVKTKVPALLFGIMPALALACGVLITQVVQKKARAWLIAAAIVPAAYLLTVDWFPGHFWSFADKLTPDMAVWPHVPLQLGLGLVIFFVLLAVAAIFTRLVKKESIPNRVLTSLAGLLVKVAVMVPFVALLVQAADTRAGFKIIKDYNPAAQVAYDLSNHLPEKAALIIEGVTNGRQRPDLTLSFITGKSAHLVRGHSLARTVPRAAKIGSVFLLTSIKRQAAEILSPSPGSGYWVYELKDSLPEPLIHVQDAARLTFSGTTDLVKIIPGVTEIKAGSSLPILAIWQFYGLPSNSASRIILKPVAGGPDIAAFPLEQDFPQGYQATILHTLAPAGLLWGSRPLGTDLVERHRLRTGQRLADDFVIWIPLHLDPGDYRIELTLFNQGREQKPISGAAWPTIKVLP
jgi:4-amino-4-deoxy-L-arabinose transferase-like glycosyltransferase